MKIGRREFFAGGLLLLGGCSQVPLELDYEKFKFFSKKYQKEKEDSLRFHIKGILENTVKIKSYFEKDGKLHMKKGKALITNGHLITVAHVTLGYYYKNPRYLIDLNGKETNLEKIVVDKKNDVAVFKLPENYPRPDYEVRLGDSRELRLIDEVYLIGNPFEMGTETRKGIVSHEFGKKADATGRTSLGFSISIKGYPSDSGTPAINENGEVLGLLSKIYAGVSRIKPINWFKQHFRD